MAQNITLMGASYEDVPSVLLPKTGGGTAEFFDGYSVTYSMTGGAYATATPDTVVAGEGFTSRIKVPAGYVLSGITVTMGGVDITSSAVAYESDPVLRDKTITSNGTYTAEDDGYDGYSEVTVDVSSGGGNIGGLSEMVDVNSYDNSWGYLLMCLKKGDTAGGKVTYTSAFSNTETKILETGLTTLHGIMFSRYDVNVGTNVDGQPNKTVFIFLNSAGTLSAVGMYASGAARIYGQAQGTVQQGVPLNGAVRFSGGDVYYTGRYNKNASYQMLKVNTEYEWLAW